MTKLFSLPIVKRKLVCVTLGIAAGFLCAYLGWIGVPEFHNDPNYWWSPMMWTTVFNRFLIGMFVLLGGFVTIMPLFNLRFYPFLRGTIMGAVVSGDMAIGALIGGGVNACTSFWIIIIAGALYGLLIDVIATRVAGEGKRLLEGVA